MKYHLRYTILLENVSPSTRREWIEIVIDTLAARLQYVSLHTEGVD